MSVGKEDALKESARKLSKHMKEISEGGRVVGLDRIAVMAALNISGEMIAAEEANSTYRKTWTKDYSQLKKLGRSDG